MLSAVLALCLLFHTSVCAGELNQDNTQGTTTLKVSIGEAYTLVIPAALNISYGAAETDLPLKVTGYRLMPDHILKLSQSFSGKLKNEDNKTIAYALKYKGSDVDGSLNYVTFTDVGTQNLVVAIGQSEWNAAESGEYTDTVTFTSAIIAKPED